MYLRAQIGSLDWQPWNKCSLVKFSAPPTSATQSANVQLTLNQDVFDRSGFQLEDVYDISFVKVSNDYVPQGDDIVVVVVAHNRTEGEVPIWGDDPDAPGRVKAIGTQRKRSSYLTLNGVQGGALKYASITIGVDTEHVETAHEAGDRFLLTLRRVERRAKAGAA